MSHPLRDIFGRRTALVVDDDPAILAIARRALEADGFDVLEAANGRDALGILAAADRVDVIVADLEMPHLDGRRLAAHLADRDSAPPVLFISGYDSPPTARQLPGPFLAKPFRPEQLRLRVRQLLG